MKTRLPILWSAAAIVLLSAASGAAATSEELYLKKWAKVSGSLSDPTTYDKPRSVCVCTEGAQNGSFGTLLRVTNDRATCYIPTFGGDGAISVMSPCGGTFEMIK